MTEATPATRTATSASCVMNRLKKRSEFLNAARGARAARSAFVLQGLCERPAEAPPRFGFTVTKRTGNSVERNRIRRRLKAAVKEVLPQARGGCDYVLIGRRKALRQPFDRLTRDLSAAIGMIHKTTRSPRHTA
ncbi:ribonuclease P protein component [Rhodobium orientis]|nr:ribonuclease P protein component [Rhodobium orientis]MBB4304684.1 ribonuclease P protein component [Rhodobium orientis]